MPASDNHVELFFLKGVMAGSSGISRNQEKGSVKFGALDGGTLVIGATK